MRCLHLLAPCTFTRTSLCASTSTPTLDLEHTEPSAVERALRAADLVFVTGGYAIFLLQHVHRTHLDQILRQAVTSGRPAYVGISAGAALAGPDLHFFRDRQDPGQATSTTGLDLVPLGPRG
ncbi:hypothetical protein GCM10023085_60080 [Actinomadura viridis]|uniref:Type 1 glutamine amidotransferase-like domain-containing protein n=1 Tax=Actinomadura viridis TaxID=58110 RepID=UPI0018CABC95